MKLSLMENGLDSLKKGYKALNTYDELLDANKEDIEKSLALKEAILNIHHGIEILMKYLLYKKSEYLVFSNIDDNVKKAYCLKNQNKLSSIFETSVIDKIHTVTYSEAFERLTKICNYEFSKKFSDKIEKLNIYRNRITHSEVTIDDQEIAQLFDGLIDSLDIYFFKYIGEGYKTLSGYSDLVCNYEAYMEHLYQKNMPLKAEVIKKLVDIFQELYINIGCNEVKRIDDINICTQFINKLYSTGFVFGTDLYDLTCSGDVSKIKRIDDSHFSLFCDDINLEVIFKFKSLIIYMPEYNSNFSPIFIFEADNDNNLNTEHKVAIKENYVGHNKYIIEGIKISTHDEIIFSPEKVYNINNINNICNSSYHNVVQHLSRCMFSIFNIQGLNYGNFDNLLFEYQDLSSVQFQNMLKKITHLL